MKLFPSALLAMISLCAARAPAHAQGPAPDEGRKQAFTIDGKDVAFIWFRDRHITLSANCVAGGKPKPCAASRAIRRADSSKLTRDLFGRNPGALLCSAQLGGTVVWSRDSRGDERTFCAFRDGSLVGSGTLAYYGRRSPEAKSSR